MKSFEGITFQGTFRPYQKRVLDNSKKYLKNNKIHIVAAPGSGKTILGLELIRRLGCACLVLSPTNTIRYQWGDRFESMFLPKTETADDFVSFDLQNIKPITSITYQALHSAIDKVACKDEDGMLIDYSDIDLFKTIKKYGIKTICVDEAHHLQNEWQKALEKFIGALQTDIKVIALTATPPYDASPTEWSRYINICGEIDEEIFVTELVKAKNLCPHQDYIYLNYPTAEESLTFKKHHEKVINSLKVLSSFHPFSLLGKRILHCRSEEFVLNEQANFTAVFALLNSLKIPFDDKKAKKLLSTDRWLRSLETFERAINFLLEKENLLSPQEKESLIAILKKSGLIERNKVKLILNSRLEKKLQFSLGKLESIAKIAKCEQESQKDNLRMLILTDYIRKNTQSQIGTEKLFKDISVVSIFETLRRLNPLSKIAILSGTYVVLHSSLEEKVRTLLGAKSKTLSCQSLADTGYSEFRFKVSNKEKVRVVGQLFEEGEINILVGTKALLGEGWDSPCINSLIMASFVGSFMLSNQMRGRAIRVYKKDQNKTANIWHLATLMPATEKAQTDENIFTMNEESSSDYKTLKRRFDCFVGPHYSKPSIENGISRISILKESYSPAQVKELNLKMEQLACNRSAMAAHWEKYTTGNGQMYIESTIPRERTPKLPALCPLPVFLGLIALLCLSGVMLANFAHIQWAFVGLVVATIFLGIGTAVYIYKILLYLSATLYVRLLAKTLKICMQEISMLERKCKLKVKYDFAQHGVCIMLKSNNIKQQKKYHAALAEIFSYLKNPTYIICKRFFGKMLYKYCFQIPSELAKNKGGAYLFHILLFMLRGYKIIYATKPHYKTQAFRCKCFCLAKNYLRPVSQKQRSG